MKSLLAACFLALFAVMLSLPAWAQRVSSKWDLPDRLQVNVGAFFLDDVDTKTVLRSTTTPAGVIISFDKDLGVEERDVTPRVDGFYRFNRRHRLDFSYFQIERDGINFIRVDIPGGIINGPVNEGALVDTTFDQKIFKINYLFSFFNTEKAEFGLGGGLHSTDIDLTIQPVGKPPVTEGTQLIPLPVASALVGYNISPRWSFMARLDVFALEYKDFTGSMSDMRLVLEHHTFKNVGFGFGLNRFDLNVEASNDDILGEIDNTYNGFLLYVTTYTGKTRSGSQLRNKN
ncbi:MAG: hypothetical protein ACE5H7_11895 [Acidiferrobacterales bacterium]